MDKFVTVRHLRWIDENDEVSPFGGVTVLAVVNLTDPDNRTIDYSMAFCSDKDHFSKEEGRSKALSHMLAGEVYNCMYTDYETDGGIMDQIANDIMQFDTKDEARRLFLRSQNFYG